MLKTPPTRPAIKPRSSWNKCTKPESRIEIRDGGKLQETVLHKIARAGLEDFKSPLKWGQWCRAIAAAALDSDYEQVAHLEDKP